MTSNKHVYLRYIYICIILDIMVHIWRHNIIVELICLYHIYILHHMEKQN